MRMILSSPIRHINWKISATLPNAIYDSGALRNGTYVVMEHSRESVIALDEQKYEILRKAFGQTTVLILKAIVPRATTRT